MSHKKNAVDELSKHGWDSDVFLGESIALKPPNCAIRLIYMPSWTVLKLDGVSHGQVLNTPDNKAAYQDAIDHLTPKRAIWFDDLQSTLYTGDDSERLFASGVSDN